MFISCVKIFTKCYEVNILRNKKSNKKKRKEMLGSTTWLPMSVREHHLRRLLLLLFGALVHPEKGNETKAVCITCVACVRPSARSGRKSSARIPANARAYDWICDTALVSFPFSAWTKPAVAGTSGAAVLKQKLVRYCGDLDIQTVNSSMAFLLFCIRFFVS